MPTPTFLNANDSLLSILFPEEVTEMSFEHVLADCYKKTFSATAEIITFDFANVLWCGVFELSIISLWMLDLSDQGKSVDFKFPKDHDAKKFLATYGFNSFLETNQFATSGSLLSMVQISGEFRPIFPLTFFKGTDYKNVISDLTLERRYEAVLKTVIKAQIVKTGVIRDVVLKELIDNIRIHSNTMRSNIIMTKFRSSSPSRASRYEESFFNRLRGGAYLTLVISDSGKGIHKKLTDAYKKDDILPLRMRSRNPKHNDILQYSFLSHSTSRSLEERIGDIHKVLASEDWNLPPDTGLFRLKEVVREFRGLLYVRSGSSILSYDFLSDPDREIPKSNIDFKQKRKTEILGTQFKLHFPIETPQRQVTLVPQYRTKDVNKNRQYSHLPIQQFLPKIGETDFRQESIIIQKFCDKFDSLILSHPAKTIVIDFENTSVLSSKAIHFILYKAIQKQTNATTAIAVNLGSSFQEPDQKRFKEIHKNVVHFQPLCVVAKTQIRSFLGLSKSEASLLLDLVKAQNAQSLEMKELAGRFIHLFELDAYSDCYQFSHSIEEINRFVRLSKKNQILIAIETPEVFKRNQKVLLPSKMYCEGYFEVRRLLENDFTFNNIVSWVVYWMLDLKLDFVISISGQMGEIADMAIKRIFEATGNTIRHVNLQTPVSNEELIGLVFKLRRGEKGIVFSEVTGSTKTLKSVLRNCQKGEIIKVLTLVDAVEINEDEIEQNGKKIKIESVFKHPLTYSPFLRPNWQYSDVSLVDPITHFLIPPFEFGDPLWKSVQQLTKTVGDERIEVSSNDFFDECIIPENLFCEGHFSNGNTHLIYYFDIPKLAIKFGYEISEVIAKNMPHILNLIDQKPTHVIYLEKNPGVDELARHLCLQFEGSIPYPISSDVLDSEIGEFSPSSNMKTVVVIDDALVSGETMLKIYDLVERLGASNILAIALINRGHEHVLRRFKKITGYGNVEIQFLYLADARILNYSVNDCPVCLRIEGLTKAKKAIDDEFFSKFIENEFSRLVEIPVSEAENQFRLTTSSKESLVLRWKLELAKDPNFPAIRKELTTILKSFDEEPNNAIAIIKILHREKSSFIFNNDVRKVLFYDSFVKELLKVCWSLVYKANTIMSTDFEAVFFILTVFDALKLMDQLPKILSLALIDSERFLRVLLQLFLMEESAASPRKLHRIFSEIYDSAEMDADLRKTFEQTMRYWHSEEERLGRLKNERIQYFKDLTGGILHEEEHIKNALIHSLNGVRINEVTANWSSFSSEVSKIAPLVRGCVDFHVSDILANTLSHHLRELQENINFGHSLIKNFQVENSSQIQEENPTLIQLNKVIENIDRIIKGDNGIEVTLDHLRTNVRKVLSRVLKGYKNELEREKLNVVKELPGETCLVFGEYTKVFEIFGNLIKNVIEWAKADNLIVRIELKSDQAHISFIDDGIGIKKKPLEDSSLFNFGLDSVRKIAHQNCGDFEILTIRKGTKDYIRGYRTHLLVTLPYFPVKE